MKKLIVALVAVLLLIGLLLLTLGVLSSNYLYLWVNRFEAVREQFPEYPPHLDFNPHNTYSGDLLVNAQGVWRGNTHFIFVLTFDHLRLTHQIETEIALTINPLFSFDYVCNRYMCDLYW